MNPIAKEKDHPLKQSRIYPGMQVLKFRQNEQGRNIIQPRQSIKKKPTFSIILHWEKLQVFPLRFRSRPLQFCIVLKVLVSYWARKRSKRNTNWKGKKN